MYSRKDTTAKVNSAGRCYDDQYGWLKKYGDSPQKAFEAVRAEIVKVAEAAAEGKLDVVQKANLGEVVRWKLAFLYQDPNDPVVMPIYKLSVLRALLDSPKISAAEAHKRLHEMAKEKSLAGAGVFDYAGPLWIEGVKKLEELNLTAEAVKDFLDGYSDWTPSAQTASALLAGYRTQYDQPLALVREEKNVQLILMPGDWHTKVSDTRVKLKTGIPCASHSSRTRLPVDWALEIKHWFWPLYRRWLSWRLCVGCMTI